MIAALHCAIRLLPTSSVYPLLHMSGIAALAILATLSSSCTTPKPSNTGITTLIAGCGPSCSATTEPGIFFRYVATHGRQLATADLV